MTLADTEIRSPYRAGKYGIDIDGFEQAGMPALRQAFQQSDSVTIMLNPQPWTDVIKRQPQVHLTSVTRDNYRRRRQSCDTG